MDPWLVSGRGPGAYVAPGGSNGDGDGGFQEPPTVTVLATGDVTIKGKVKPGSFGKFVYPIAAIAANRRYTFRAVANFTQLSQSGNLAMIGFGLKNNNDFHIAGLKGNGASSVKNYIVDGTPPNGWNKQTGHTEVDLGLTLTGVTQFSSYYRLTTSSDGTTYTIENSPDNVTWTTVESGRAPAPFSNVSSVTEFGVALWFNNTDTGPFSVSITSYLAEVSTSYANTGGTGDRTGSITISSNAVFAAGSASNLINGTYNTDTWWNAGQSSIFIKLDFGVGASKVIDEIKWRQDINTSHGTWVLEGSNDDSSYTTFSPSFTLGDNFVDQNAVTNQTGYRYYKLRQTAGVTSNSPFLLELELKIA